ncbi:MAG: hypothetical protein ACO1OQ_10325 [Rufibacter sp.]
MYKILFSAATARNKNLALPFSRTGTLLRCSKNASAEPHSGRFRLQNRNLRMLLMKSYFG